MERRSLVLLSVDPPEGWGSTPIKAVGRASDAVPFVPRTPYMAARPGTVPRGSLYVTGVNMKGQSGASMTTHVGSRRRERDQKRRQREEARWQSLCGPVTVRQATPEELARVSPRSAPDSVRGG